MSLGGVEMPEVDSILFSIHAGPAFVAICVGAMTARVTNGKTIAGLFVCEICHADSSSVSATLSKEKAANGLAIDFKAFIPATAFPVKVGEKVM